MNKKIISGKEINKALEKMNNWHFRDNENSHTTFDKLKKSLKKNWLWKNNEIEKLFAEIKRIQGSL
jgi:hypothetical protein|tara:strand:+ start:183 stop:380 length:198 start_codon:yes stop_codon:yes gene_type:complete